MTGVHLEEVVTDASIDGTMADTEIGEARRVVDSSRQVANPMGCQLGNDTGPNASYFQSEAVTRT